jgi:hypothetical protein
MRLNTLYPTIIQDNNNNHNKYNKLFESDGNWRRSRESHSAEKNSEFEGNYGGKSKINEDNYINRGVI